MMDFAASHVAHPPSSPLPFLFTEAPPEFGRQRQGIAYGPYRCAHVGVFFSVPYDPYTTGIIFIYLHFFK